MNDGACMVSYDLKYSLVSQKNVNTRCGNLSTFKESHNALSVTYSK